MNERKKNEPFCVFDDNISAFNCGRLGDSKNDNICHLLLIIEQREKKENLNKNILEPIKHDAELQKEKNVKKNLQTNNLKSIDNFKDFVCLHLALSLSRIIQTMQQPFHSTFAVAESTGFIFITHLHCYER